MSVAIDDGAAMMEKEAVRLCTEHRNASGWVPHHGTLCLTMGGVMASRHSVMESVVDREYGEAEFNDLKKLYEGTMGKISEGEIVKGRIAAIGDSDVSIDIGFKSEGLVAKSELAGIPE